jgi:transposase-like protein
MNKPTRFPAEFKIEAVKQVNERGHRVAEVATRLDVSRQLVRLNQAVLQDSRGTRSVGFTALMSCVDSRLTSSA